jgi:hypothetical protein
MWREDGGTREMTFGKVNCGEGPITTHLETSVTVET